MGKNKKHSYNNHKNSSGPVVDEAEAHAKSEASKEASEPKHEVHYQVLSAEEATDPETKSFKADVEEEKEHFRAEFPGHEALRERAPQAFKVADAVVDEWKNDGDFNGIPVGHPLAQVAVGAGLRQVKKIEKKLEEKGVFMMAKMGLEFAKAKAEQANNPILNKILEKINK